MGALTVSPCTHKRSSAAGCSSESRVILDEGLKWSSRRAVEDLLERITSAGFNVFMPNVWRGDGATWPTDVAPYLAKWAFDNPFRYLLLRAKEVGVEVHPWISIIKRKGDKIRDFDTEGAPTKFFNVHNPAFRDFIKAVIDDFVATYPEIDGLNLDYVRAGGVCNSRFCAESYHAFTGRDFAKDHGVPLDRRIQLQGRIEGLLCAAVGHKLDPDEKTAPPNIADRIVIAETGLQGTVQLLAL